MREIELKILLDEAGAKRLRAAVKAAAMAGPRTARRQLTGVYYDTAEGALAARGVALRLRKEGRRWVQTVKAGGAVQGGLSSVAEADCVAPGGRLALEAIPDPDLRALVLETLDGVPPAPVYETSVIRETWTLTPGTGGEIELALDAGEIRAGETAEQIIEAELELKQGDARAIYAAARALFGQTGPIRFSRRSKAARARALASGEPAVSSKPAPVMAAPATLRAEMTTEQAAQETLRACLDQISGNVAVSTLTDAPEGPHQLRVGLRRLRTAAMLFRPVIGGPALDALSAKARDFAAEIGRARDLDVLEEEMIAPLADLDPGFKALTDAIARRRATARRKMKAHLAEPETTRFLFDLGEFIEARGWLDRGDIGQTTALAAPVGETAEAALDRAWKKCARLARLIDHLEGEERHDLRKRLKKLRYAIEFFAPLYPRRKVRALLKPLKTLQDDFGALQDAATARALLTARGAPGAGDAQAQRAVGLLLGRKEAEAELLWGRVKTDWKALAAEGPFWR